MQRAHLGPGVRAQRTGIHHERAVDVGDQQLIGTAGQHPAVAGAACDPLGALHALEHAFHLVGGDMHALHQIGERKRAPGALGLRKRAEQL